MIQAINENTDTLSPSRHTVHHDPNYHNNRYKNSSPTLQTASPITTEYPLIH